MAASTTPEICAFAHSIQGFDLVTRQDFSNPSRGPKIPLPSGTIDCHFHVFGPSSYAYAGDRSYTPPDASLAEYEKMARTLGISRSVIIQPSPYGFDNSRTLSAMAESAIPMRAILVLDPNVSDNALAEYHNLGVRGVRLNAAFSGGIQLTLAQHWADRLRDLEWHLQFLTDVSNIANLGDFVRKLRIPVVFDHLGYMPAQKSISNPAFQGLLALVREELAWVKLSAGYRVSAVDRAPFHDTRPLIDALIAANPRQLVWGTDWPHPAIDIPSPNDAVLADQITEWVQDQRTLEAILVNNPQRLYGFAPL